MRWLRQIAALLRYLDGLLATSTVTVTASRDAAFPEITGVHADYPHCQWHCGFLPSPCTDRHRTPCHDPRCGQTWETA